MLSREALYKEIVKELKKESGLKARVIARRLSVERSAVNSILYCKKYRDSFQKDEYYKWSLKEEQLTFSIKHTSKHTVIPSKAKQNQPAAKPSCKKCMLYKSGMCFGEKTICGDFKNSPDISEEEMAMWPKQMGGAYGNLHNTYQPC